MKRYEQAILDMENGVIITTRDQVFGLLEAVQCGKISVISAEERLGKWVAQCQERTAVWIREEMERQKRGLEG